MSKKITGAESWTKQDLEKRQADLLKVFSDKWELNVDLSQNQALNTQGVESVKVEQNGVVRPKEGTVTGRVWKICDAIAEQAKAMPERKHVLSEAAKMQINEATARTQFARWKKFNS